MQRRHIPFAIRHKSSSSLSAALADPDGVSAGGWLPGELDGGCRSTLSMLMWSNTRATACEAQKTTPFDDATKPRWTKEYTTSSQKTGATCLTVAAAVLTTLSELRDVPSRRKQMPRTAPMLSCPAGRNTQSTMLHFAMSTSSIQAAVSSPQGAHAQAIAAMSARFAASSAAHPRHAASQPVAHALPCVFACPRQCIHSIYNDPPAPGQRLSAARPPPIQRHWPGASES
jgi:hypothetical protein